MAREVVLDANVIVAQGSIAPTSSPNARMNLGGGFETTAQRSFCSTCRSAKPSR
jgi:hypothetical protein